MRYRAAMHPRQIFGHDGEAAAERFLREAGYVILVRNYRCRSGEIDLIALDGEVLVFIEVKARSADGYGDPFDAVDDHKQHRVIRAAEWYVHENDLHGRDARFDVVGVWRDGGQLHCELIRDAFELP